MVCIIPIRNSQKKQYTNHVLVAQALDKADGAWGVLMHFFAQNSIHDPKYIKLDPLLEITEQFLMHLQVRKCDFRRVHYLIDQLRYSLSFRVIEMPFLIN